MIASPNLRHSAYTNVRIHTLIHTCIHTFIGLLTAACHRKWTYAKDIRSASLQTLPFLAFRGINVSQAYTYIHIAASKYVYTSLHTLIALPGRYVGIIVSTFSMPREIFIQTYVCMYIWNRKKKLFWYDSLKCQKVISLNFVTPAYNVWNYFLYFIFEIFFLYEFKSGVV